ncbi:hypothetical protein PRZ48_014403 [Zasmidium cellare]|uniref:Mid2 domain-containing protein n=1 Tax=Zasmidium cellare TaxID=395010 RepID=A0ABR0DY89_ZASCE|nr:hypothetical protein PRZ48_014403 [Zasmidium cellare]
MWLHFLAFTFLAVLQNVAAYVAPNNNVFIFPPASGPSLNYVGNLAWSLGTTQKVEWTTTLTSYDMELWQQGIDPGIGYSLGTVFTANGDGSGDKSFEWTVQTYSTNLTFSPIFFLWLNPNKQDGFSSHYFNITKDPSSSSSSILSTSTSALPSSTSATSAALVSASATAISSATTTPTASHDSGLTLNAGLGVGLGVGIPLVLIAGVFIGMKVMSQRRRSRRPDELLVPLGAMSKDSSYMRYSDACPEYPKPAYYPNEHKDRTRYLPPVEMGPKTPAELG